MDKLILVGKGASSEQFLQLQLLPPKDNPLYGAEVWAINSMGTIIHCDKMIVMDSISLTIATEGNVDWTEDKINLMKKTQLPIISIEEYEGLNVELYPIEEVTTNFGGFQYFNTTVAYALALAITRGVKFIGLFGIDFTWTHVNKSYCEEGRACVEFWLGIAMEKGIRIQIPGTSTLMDSYNGRRLYGYWDLEQSKKENGELK